MKAPLVWVADYVDPPSSINDLVHRLTLSGSEVEEVVTVGENWDDIVVGRVTSLERPEGSRTLNVATLDLGGESVIAVTAAPNIAAGQTVPVVRIGGLVPRGPEGVPFTLKPRPMMGITGEAMVLSARELGISDEHAGILALPDHYTPGHKLSRYIGGTVLDIAVTANRPDEMAILGVAREVAAITGTDLRQPDLTQPDGLVTDSGMTASVTIEAPDLCPRYTAIRVSGIRVGPSPEWLRTRLEAAGVRSINNVVDVTNFVMLELGQPLHAFDFKDLAGGRIIVRRAGENERIVTLDGTERGLTPEMLVIADGEKAVAIAGVMGGEHSEVSATTSEILIESANFDRVSVRRTSRNLGLRSEASARFERGVPAELTEIAVRRCLHLLGRVMAGPPATGPMADVTSEIQPLPAITFAPDDLERLLGVPIAAPAAATALTSVGFEVVHEENGLRTTPPYWRRDVEGVADIAEEIARLIGYDHIPETLPGQQTRPAALPPDLAWEAEVRDTLWGIGLTEAWTDTLTGPASLERLRIDVGASGEGLAGIVANPSGLAHHGATAEPLTLMNSPTVDKSVPRPTLIPSLLDVVARNLKHTREGIAFFELARTFFPRPNDLPYERRTLAIALAGDRGRHSWNLRPGQYDFFDLKGMVASVLRRMGYRPAEVSTTNSGIAAWRLDPPGSGSGAAHHILHPGRRADLVVDGNSAGYLGELHPVLADRFEIPDSVRALIAEIDLDVLMAHARDDVSYRPVSRYPSVKRDLSIALPEDVDAATVQHVVATAGGELLHDVRIMDVYAGETLGTGRRSLMLSLEFQSETETLTQEQVSDVQNGIVTALATQLGGELRG